MDPAGSQRRAKARAPRPRRTAALAVLAAAVIVVVVVGAVAAGSGEGGNTRSWTVMSLDLRGGMEASQSSETSGARSSSPDTSGPAAGGASSDPAVLGKDSTTLRTDTPVSTASSTADSTTALYSEEELAALASPLPDSAKAVEVPVLMYHYVDETPPPAGPYADSLTVRTPDFEEQLKYLKENGYHPVTLADVYLAMAGVRPLPAKAVVLTFDDGGLDNYEVAFPLLEQQGFVATFFVITKRVGVEGQMNWDQLREMAAAGMAIQSHTVSHPDLTGLSDERLKSELVDSRAAILEGVGAPVYALSYPAGAHDQRVMQAARAAGYVIAVATDKGGPPAPSTVLEIKRARIQASLSLSSFARIVSR